MKSDFLVFGATGFTGRLTAQKMAALCEKHGTSLTLAARNAQKLEALAQELRAAHPSLTPRIVTQIADVQDREAIRTLVQSARVILNTAGPFARYAPFFYEACAEFGTDYLDLTGEVGFVARMIERHHEAARISGARLIPCAGFDSIPSDLGTYALVEEWKQRFPSARLQSVVALFQARGGFNGGTLASLFEILKSEDLRKLADPQLLTPAEGPMPPASEDWTGVHWIPELKRFAGPFFMAPVNTRIVRRSQALFAQAGDPVYGQFHYEEGMLDSSPVPFTALAASVGTILSEPLLKAPRTRAWFERLAPAPGEGPSEEVQRTGFMKVTLIARGGTSEKPLQLRGVFRGSGDPGNRITTALFCEAALCLGLPELRRRLPDTRGILPPAFALRSVLLERVHQHEDFSLEFSEGS